MTLRFGNGIHSGFDDLPSLSYITIGYFVVTMHPFLTLPRTYISTQKQRAHHGAVTLADAHVTTHFT